MQRDELFKKLRGHTASRSDFLPMKISLTINAVTKLFKGIKSFLQEEPIEKSIAQDSEKRIQPEKKKP